MNVRNTVIRTSLWLGAALFLSVTTAGTLSAQTAKPPVNKPAPEAWFESGAGTVQPGLARTAGATDRAVARVWISGLDVRTHNWGDMGSYVWGFTPFYYTWSGGRHAGHYSASMALAIGPGPQANPQVHQSDGRFTPSSQMDWEAQDGARGEQYASPPVTYGSYPMFAHSDQPASWPAAGWPAPEGTSAIWLDTATWPKWARRADLEAYAEFNDDGADRNAESMTLGIDAKKRILGYAGDDVVFFQWELTNNGSYSLTDCYVGFFADLAGPVYNVSVGTPDWDRSYQMHYTEGAHYNATAGTHDDGSGTVLPWFGYMFLESPTGSFKADASGDTVDSPSTVMTRVALLDYSDWIQSMDPNLYGALSGETSYMTGTEIQAVWKTDPPILIQDRDDYLAVYAAGDPVGYFASGPFPFGPGETIDFVMAYVAGETKPDMYSTADFAITTYQAQFQTSGPPPSPTLKAAGTLAGTHGMVYDSNIHAYQIYYTPSGSVTLYWDGGPSEMTLDAITGNIEFEGYRIYKSTNRGATWGNPITDTQGNRIGWTPFAKFDLNNGIKGPDPSGSGKYLGDDTGLQHSFTDIDVMDGYEYWYAITAYDYAPPLKSYESSIGNSPTAPNVVSVMTGSTPSGMVMGTVSSTAPLPLVSGPASAGSASVSVVDLMALQNATYRITTVDSAKYNGELVANRLGVTLTNVTTGTILLDALMPDDVDLGSGLLPVVNGVTIDVNTVFNSTTADDRLVDYTFPTGLGSAAGWPLVYGADFLGSSLDPADINDAARFFSMEVRFDTLETQMAYASHYPTAWYISSYQEVPFTVWDVSSVPERQVNVAYRIMAPGTVPTFRLTTNYLNRHYMYFLSSDYSGATADTAYLPGGTLNYVRSNDVVYAGWWNLEGTATSEKDLHGLVFSVEYLVPMGPGAVYQFSTTASAIDAAQVTLDDIKVVPNPYYIFERWDRNINSRKLQFINVPENATIDIYTLAGELVASLDHGASYNADKIGVVDWNMWTYEFTEAAYGLYLYVVKTDDGQTKVGKFAIIR